MGSGDLTAERLATTLRLLLSHIDSGDISADRPQERGMVRQIRGALAVLDALPWNLLLASKQSSSCPEQ